MQYGKRIKNLFISFLTSKLSYVKLPGADEKITLKCSSLNASLQCKFYVTANFMIMSEPWNILRRKLIFPLYFDKIIAYVRVFFLFSNELWHSNSWKYFSVEIGKTVDLGHEFYIEICIKYFCKFSFPFVIEKNKFSHVKLLCDNGKFTFNYRSYKCLTKLLILHFFTFFFNSVHTREKEAKTVARRNALIDAALSPYGPRCWNSP